MCWEGASKSPVFKFCHQSEGSTAISPPLVDELPPLGPADASEDLL